MDWCSIVDGVLAQLGEHLPYKQRVTGSSPVGPIFYVYITFFHRPLACFFVYLTKLKSSVRIFVIIVIFL